MSETPDASEHDTAAQCRQLFEAAEPGLRAFLMGRLKQPSDVDDCLQVTFIRLMEKGQEIPAGARKAWLFRVAANQAAQVWRRQATTERVLRRHQPNSDPVPDPLETAIDVETAAQIQQAINRLPDSWQRVVRMRIHDNLTFQQIADQLAIPLGTALTRMRRALERIKRDLQIQDSDEND